MSAHKSAKWSALVRRPVRSLRHARDHDGRRSPPGWALEPLEVPTVEHPDVGDTPQDRWSAVEDLWTRLSQHTPVQIQADADFTRLVIRQAVDPAARHDIDMDLLARVQDPRTYRWRVGSLTGSFVLHVETERLDLVVWLMQMSLIRTWPGGQDLCWQVHAWLSLIGCKCRAEWTS